MSRDDAVFIVDSDAWITMHEDRYCPDIFGGLWTLMRACGEEERVKMPREVMREVGGDRSGVGAWIRTIQPTIIAPVTPAIGARVGEIMLAYPRLVDQASQADPWLIAFAEHHGWVVVTEEKPSSGGKPKIPNVCMALDVECIDCTEMIRRLGIRWESDEGDRSSGPVRLPASKLVRSR